MCYDIKKDIYIGTVMEFMQQLGRGGYGTVLANEHSDYVIKECRMRDQDDMKRFAAEYEVSPHAYKARLSPRCYGILLPEKDSVKRLLYDRVYGRTLDSWHFSNPSEYKCKKVFHNLVKQLHRLKSFDWSHNDIKGDNIMVTTTGWVYLIDWGMATPHWSEEGLSHDDKCAIEEELDFFMNKIPSKDISQALTQLLGKSDD